MLHVVCRALCLLPLALLAACTENLRSDAGQVLQQINGQSGSATLTESEIVSGLREALAQGTTRAINQLGRSDGFWANAAARIPLPPPISGMEKTLRQFGQGQRVDDFHLTLNRAAELAVPEVANILGDAVRQMSVQDARSILQGPDDAATQYFQRVAAASIRQKIRPLVQAATERVGVTQTYKRLLSKAAPVLQYAGKGSAVDLDDYVTDQAQHALFDAIAAEEARIRANPAARGSEILRRVFGSQ